jgi:hypothetical protein
MLNQHNNAFADFRLGESNTSHLLDGLEDFQRVDQMLLRQTRRELCIMTPNFEAERYNTQAFADTLSTFVRQHRYAEARIFLADLVITIRWGHQLVNLARRPPSRLYIR